MTYEELVVKLRKLRTERNWGLRDVAYHAHRTISVIHDLEKGRITRPRLDTLTLWAYALGYRLRFSLEKIEDD